MTENEFIKYINELNITPTDKQLEQLKKYYQIVIEYNQVMNLTGITDQKEFYLKHFYDSLTLKKIIDLSKIDTMCDIGSGAGFPGIVIKILFPNIKITLIDSLNKRINFLNHVIKELKLNNIEAIHERAEIYAKKNIEKFDLVTARAVAKNSILLEYSIPMLKIGGKFIAMKGNIQNESDYSNALKLLYSKQIMIEKFTLPIEESSRTLIMIEKQKSTSGKYPRNTNEIKKKPL